MLDSQKSIHSLTGPAIKGTAELYICAKFQEMQFTVQVKVMPLKELLDPQGKAVKSGLGNMGMNKIEDVRIGKNITLQIEAASAEEARSIAEQASKKLLANPVMEYYEIEVA